jgi:hypothetical protein
MRRISIIAAALMLYAAPASANDIEDAVLNLTVNCLHSSIWTNLAADLHPADGVLGHAATICEPVLLDYAKRNYPNTDLKNIHEMVMDEARKQADEYMRQRRR